MRSSPRPRRSRSAPTLDPARERSYFTPTLLPRDFDPVLHVAAPAARPLPFRFESP
jgi:hypothetical protein